MATYTNQPKSAAPTWEVSGKGIIPAGTYGHAIYGVDKYGSGATTNYSNISKSASSWSNQSKN